MKPKKEPKILSKNVFPKEEDGPSKILLMRDIKTDVVISMSK
jgi:hypothetical protein|tara:strand:+ start:479 stop:604 length:126 start_codon:yes stop_codon:yes gene_type:complete